MARFGFVNELFYPRKGGVPTVFYELGAGLVNRGHQVHLFTTRHNKTLPKYEKMGGIHVYRFIDAYNYFQPGNRSVSGVLKFSLGSFFKMLGKRFDLIFSAEIPFLHSLTLNFLNTPLVQYWADVLDGMIFHSLQKVLAKTIDHHIANSLFTAKKLAKQLNISPQKIHISFPGIHPKQYSCDAASRRKNRIIFLGRLVPHKRIDLLIQAFQIVKEEIPSAELRIAGWGPLSQHYKNVAKDMERVTFHGFLSEEEKKKYLSSASLLVLPSELEGFGLVVAEALASGTPAVIAGFPNNGAKNVYEEGCIVTAPTRRGLARGITKVLKNEGLWRSLQSEGLQVAKRYNWEVSVEKLEESFLSIIKNHTS